MEQQANHQIRNQSGDNAERLSPHVDLESFSIPVAMLSITDGVIVYANSHFKNIIKNCVVGQPLNGFLNAASARNSVLKQIKAQKRYVFVKKIGEKDNSIKLRISVTKCNYMEVDHFLVCMERLNDEADSSQGQVTSTSAIALDRIQFTQKLTELLADRDDPKSHQCLSCIDIDQFRLINERFGLAAGDYVLQEVHKFINDNTPKNSMLARFGNNEFGLLLNDANTEVALQICEGIRRSIKEHEFIWKSDVIKLTVSIGLVQMHKLIDDVDYSFGAVNIALQAAQDNGRDRVHSSAQEDTMMHFNSGTMQYAVIIEDALRDDSFELFGQPIVSLADIDNKQHYEVLLRSYDEKAGDFISSQELINAAESVELITRVDQWVCEKVFKLLSQKVKSGETVPSLSVNISGNSIVNSSFETFITNLVDQYPVPLNQICFEITESVAVKSIARAQKFIRNLKQLGFKFSLDDFGVGYCSFNYLQQLDVDYVKIDGAFVSTMLDDTTQFAMVRAITDVARAMQIKTIAEYVEKPELIKVLAAIGVDYGQGYYFGKPEPLKNAFQNSK